MGRSRLAGMEKIKDDIVKFKFSVIYVPRDEVGPSIAYTIGLLETLRHPELVIIGSRAADAKLDHRYPRRKHEGGPPISSPVLNMKGS